MRSRLDLPEIMDAGLGLTEALDFWSRVQNDPLMSDDDARAELQAMRESVVIQPAAASSNVLQFARPSER